MKDYLMKVTTNSPRRSQYNGLLISPTTGTAVPASVVTSSSTSASTSTKVPGKSCNSHHLTPTYVKSTGASFSSLKRVKNVPLHSSSYIKSSPSSTMDNRSIYATYGRVPPPSVTNVTPTSTSNTGQYRSPSRILLESGYLTLPNSHHHHHTHGKDHVYENLYSSPNNAANTTTTTSISSPNNNNNNNNNNINNINNNSSNTADITDSSKLSLAKEKYMSNLRGSVQLKRSGTSLPCANCSSKSYSPSTSSSLDRKLYKSKSKDRKDRCPVCFDHNTGTGGKGTSNNTSGKSSHKSSQLNQQVICMKEENANGKHTNKNNSTETPTDSADGKLAKSSSSNGKKSKRKKRDWLLEVDPQRRFQFIQSTLIICNVFALFCGVTGLIVAGFVDPRPSFTSFGGQLTCVSVYIILTSLTGLYGARRESVSLLVIYGGMIVASLFFRSIFYFILTFITPSTSYVVAFSMFAAFLEVILILFAFVLAAEVRLKKLDRKQRKDPEANLGNKSANSSHNNSSSSSNQGNNELNGKIVTSKSTSNNNNNNNNKINTDRDIESASPVASNETDSTNSGELTSSNSGRFTSGSPLFSPSNVSNLSSVRTITTVADVVNSPVTTRNSSSLMVTSSRATASPYSTSFTTSSASRSNQIDTKTHSLLQQQQRTTPVSPNLLTPSSKPSPPLTLNGDSLMRNYTSSITRSINSATSTLNSAKATTTVKPAAYF